MLPKAKRLNLSKDFKFVASGVKINTHNFKVMYKFKGEEEPLVGVAISKQNFKKAVDRNRAKRLCFEVLKKIYPSLKRGLNLVIMPRAQILQGSTDDLSLELGKINDIHKTD
ncbi:MAG: hypothetical protein ACD_30C00074G0007 [uncultured bacterium]|uniref:Ribonuclease P protein component n=3 Tax=Candidatus Daviesiibacteriota TaxID=1752718 RepID=A0A0G0F2A6_9BACT|nr:MAG: hypothetical protein ACD_30C00074G0007 [uncultured bacterium]KKQ07685.1 MAG: Ribonuclease P protein component [Candidatus Daviesbacteria bacterium GW2011_GWB1_36_5]KKQ15961.1 MAG: Ribonuclease P protein component [Candidatus Daviesbacteria bacterium GW2011_GWA1_36_8]OGE33169.1 MAG: ribonuclease P protein component [Candidatus Daviesbacteria bacterium RIFCSPHIGHO2_02_FULL_37_9]OGE34986.1 MAG: ribonuclease P protein component [Candidatus Daviesbacteria bacterium RIFCSPHIGHO2_12_FULL_37_16